MLSPLPSPSPDTVDPLLHDLRAVYEDLAKHRKDVTRLMANVKRCSTKLERRMEHPERFTGFAAAAAAGVTPSTHAPSAKGKLPKGKCGKGGGLTKPYPVSTSLCTFMDVPKGTQLARAEVTKYLHHYIRSRNLYDKKDRQYIIPDSSLKSLFNMTHDSEPRVHLFTMQQKMNPHFEYGTMGVGPGGSVVSAVGTTSHPLSDADTSVDDGQ